MRENFSYKLLAIVMAALLWAKVSVDRNPGGARTLEKVRVDYVNLHLGYARTSSPQTIALTVTGPQSALRLLEASKVTATVDLSGVQPGVQSLTPEIRLPPDVAGKVTPTRQPIQIKVEAITRRSHTIDVSVEGAPPLGKSFGKAIADPAVAVVSGQSSLVDQVRRLVVTVTPRAVDSTGAYPVVALKAAGTRVKGLKIEPSEVMVSLQLVDAPLTKNVIVSPSIVGQPAFPYKVISITVTPSSVTIFGSPNSIDRASTISTEDVDITDAKDTVTHVVGLRTPSEIRTGGLRTVRVTVRIAQ